MVREPEQPANSLFVNLCVRVGFASVVSKPCLMSLYFVWLPERTPSEHIVLDLRALNAFEMRRFAWSATYNTYQLAGQSNDRITPIIPPIRIPKRPFHNNPLIEELHHHNVATPVPNIVCYISRETRPGFRDIAIKDGLGPHGSINVLELERFFP
ncbi:hypothetical protein BS17DRAFT_781894 [Gyrodon lividus]|nr:hypothetical protein BS17DRAFT_781894 [Gyrodon lividus]